MSTYKNNKAGSESHSGNTGKGNKKTKDPKTGTESPSYIGHTKELGSFLITSDGNKVKQFKELVERLSTFASNEYSAEVSAAIDNLQAATIKDFMPEPLDKTLYSSPVYDKDGQVKLANGVEVWTTDDEVKKTLELMQAQLVKKQTDLFTSYRSGLRAMFRTTLGQVDDSITSKLESMSEWGTTKATNDTVKLLTMLRELCYQDSKTSIHPMTNILRSMRKLCTSRQRDDDAVTYVREVRERFKVFLAIGGSLLMPGILKASLDHDNISSEQYRLLTADKQAEYDRRAEEFFIATVVIEGANEDTSTLRQTLAQQFTLGADLYPRESNRAQEMITEFHNSKTAKPKKTNGGPPRNSSKSDQTENSTKTTDKLKNKERDLQGQQLLLSALQTDEQFNLHEGIFFQYGEIEFASSPPLSDASVTSDTEDWNYWLEHDDSRNKNDGRTTQEPDDGPTNVCVPSTTATYVSVSTLSNDVSTSTSNRSELKSPPDGDNERKFEAVNRSIDERVTPKHRPDPPGFLPGDKRHARDPRSALDKHLRGAPNMNSRSGVQIANGCNSLTALDLAITERQQHVLWRQGAPGESIQYMYPTAIEQMFAQHRGGIDPHWLLLDSESSVNLIVNKELLENIRTAPHGANLTVHCNAGAARTDQIGDLKGFGTVWFYEDGIANVISLGLLTNKFRVTMDSDIDNALHVHKSNGDVRRFHRGDNNLYYYDVRAAHAEETLLAIVTVKGQQGQFSGIDRKRAERAMKLQEIVGYPSDKDFLRMIDNKVMRNCSITRRDIKLARQIYGKNKAAIQGKSVRTQVRHVREELSLVPESVLRNYKEVTLSVDVFHVNGTRFLGTISRHINHRTVQALTNMKKSTLLRSIQSITAKYKARGFTVRTIFADNQFECLRNDLMELEITLNVTAADEHEPFIERSIRTMKERVRCIFNNTPFKRVPTRMIIEMVYSAVFWLNSVIPENGVHSVMSPGELMTGVVLDATKHARFQFGEFVSAHQDETNNSMDPRALDTIYLRPSGNIQGGYYAFDLRSASRIHRMHGTALHMTENVINRVAEIAIEQNAPIGITFGDAHNRTTILDIDTDENEDDDDASDASYIAENDDDDTSIASVLSGTTDTSEVSGRIDESAGDNDTQITGQDVQDQSITETEDSHEEREVDAESVDNNGEREDRGGDDVEVSNDNEETINDTTNARTGLRQSVTRSHNKYGPDEGFNPTIINRSSMFTAGYGKAIDKLSKDETGYMNTAAAMALYSQLEASQVTKQYGVRQGIKKFGEEGVDAVLTELKQLHDRSVVEPMDPSKMTKEMRYQALPYLMFLKRKRCGKIKGRGCADGRRQREFISKEEASSPTVSLYALMISCLIDAIEERDVATCDIPGAFLQTDMPDGEDVYIRLDGTMAELLCRLDPKVYEPCMVKRGKSSVLYAKANKAIYGTLRAALLFYENLTSKLTEWGFVMNPYDRCTMNKIIDGSQATICWHVDDLKVSHKSPEVVTSILEQLDDEYGKISPLSVTRKKIHDYVGMTIDYTDKGTVKFSMFDYLEEIIQNLPKDFIGEAQTPASNHLFTINEDATKLNEKDSETFHHYVAKLLFMAKRTRPDIGTAIAFLCTRVKNPDVDDWKKLGRVMRYLQLTPFIPLVLGWDGTGDVSWHVDASFAVHKDMRSHTGGLMTLGKGAVISVSTKQKINTKSSTEAELVGVDDIMNIQVWTRYFIDAQYKHAGTDLLLKKDRLLQDNTSSIRLEKYGKASSTKRTRHIDIRYYFVTDRVKAGKLDIEYCPTEEMTADFFTKPLQGSLFRTHRNSVQGVSGVDYLQYKDEYFAAKNCNTRQQQRMASE